MDKRVDKAVRTRRLNAEREYKNEEYSGNSSSSGGSGSEYENTPSPPPESHTFDFGALDASGGLGALEDSKPQDIDHTSSTEPFR